MTITYSQTAIEYRLQGVIDAIDSGGSNGTLRVKAGNTVLTSISLARPCGTIDSGVLTFSGTLLDPSAAATGIADNATIENSAGVVMALNLTVGIPLSDNDIIMSNGLNSTLITAGQAVALLAATITGS